MSPFSSSPMTVAGMSVASSDKRTMTFLLPWITWSLVTTYPPLAMQNPVPTPAMISRPWRTASTTSRSCFACARIWSFDGLHARASSISFRHSLNLWTL